MERFKKRHKALIVKISVAGAVRSAVPSPVVPVRAEAGSPGDRSGSTGTVSLGNLLVGSVLFWFGKKISNFDKKISIIKFRIP